MTAPAPEPPHEPGPRLVVAAGLVWLDARRLVVGRRPARSSHGAGCLELPGGKVERGEAPATALGRELHEEWGPAAAALRVDVIADVLHHVYPAPGPEVLLLVYHVDARALAAAPVDALPLRPEPGAEVLVLERDRLPLHEFLEADRAFVRRIMARELGPPPWLQPRSPARPPGSSPGSSPG